MKIVRRRISAVSLALMLKTLQDGPATVHDLRQVTGLCVVTVRNYVLTMYREGVLRIAEWEPDSMGRYVTAAYAFGSGKDATKPRRSRSETNRMYRQRRKQIAMQNAMSA